jgi:hypothetical protein
MLQNQATGADNDTTRAALRHQYDDALAKAKQEAAMAVAPEQISPEERFERLMQLRAEALARLQAQESPPQEPPPPDPPRRRDRTYR